MLVDQKRSFANEKYSFNRCFITDNKDGVYYKARPPNFSSWFTECIRDVNKRTCIDWLLNEVIANDPAHVGVYVVMSLSFENDVVTFHNIGV
jgi:hypothetical protein